MCAGADRDKASPQGSTALDIARSEHHSACVEILEIPPNADEAAESTSIDEDEATRQRRQALLVAVGAGDVKAVEDALKAGADPNSIDLDGSTSKLNKNASALYIAAKRGDDGVVEALLTAGADPELGKKGKRGSHITVLYVAASKGYAGVVQMLVDAGVLLLV